jgi:ADP-heptose:LPS heptosyltransferase
MNIDEAINSWTALRESSCSAMSDKLISNVVDSFMTQVKDPHLQPEMRFIDLLCEMSEADDSDWGQAVTSALFRGIIEGLCDDFTPNGAETCLNVLVSILAYIRQKQTCRTLDRLLNEAGYHETSELVSRYKRIQTNSAISSTKRRKIRKIIILSRVTAGADIAITSNIIHRLNNSFPEAELVIIGPIHLAEMFNQIDATRVVPFLYKNDGTLFDKMTNWPDLLKIVHNEHHNFCKGEVLLFDPDTRLSQLGLLPLLDEENSFYFPSRTAGYNDNSQQNLSTLTNKWLDTLLEERVSLAPLAMFDDLHGTYTNLAENLKQNGCKQLITINFGVGNDPRKKITPLFEADLIKGLLAIPDTIIMLDTGRGDDEQQVTNQHLKILAELNYNTLKIDADSLAAEKINLRHGVVSYRGSLCGLGKLIKVSDCFIGYDSCGQHIANAADTPAIIIFAGAPSTRFISRWAPKNSANKTISVLPNQVFDKRELDILLKKVLLAVKKVLTFQLHPIFERSGRLT